MENKTMLEHNENINKEIQTIKNNQIKILKWKTNEGFKSRLDQTEDKGHLKIKSEKQRQKKNDIKMKRA